MKVVVQIFRTLRHATDIFILHATVCVCVAVT